jgi:hypothetical protein
MCAGEFQRGDEYSSGGVYYEFEGRPLLVLPERPDPRPKRSLLEHHRSAIV